MAGDWIKMTKDLPDKPEVWRMAGCLGIDADSVVGKLLRVWSWFDSHTEDGNAVGVTYALLDRIAGVSGFAEAMALCGWLSQNGHVMTLPNFERHNGKTAKNRALTNERVGKLREKQRMEQRSCNADAVTESVSREEKRREEELSTVDGSCPPQRKRAASASPTKGTRLPADWRLPIEWGVWALEQPGWTEAAVRLEADKFRDFWAAKPGRDGVKLDWQATWRNWIRNAKPAPFSDRVQSFRERDAELARAEAAKWMPSLSRQNVIDMEDITDARTPRLAAG